MSEAITSSAGDGAGGPKGLVFALVAIIVIIFGAVPVGVVLIASAQQEQQGTCLGPNGGQALVVSATGEALPSVDGFTPEQIQLAATIMTVAEQTGLGSNAQIIGLITAMQESTLQNLPGGDRDSIGIFQQRPSIGWGTPKQLNDPNYTATAFYEGVDTAGGFHIPGLKDISGWESMAPGDAAQAVQRSAFPDAYDKHVDDAERIMATLSGVEINIDAAACGEVAAAGDVASAIKRGKSLLGMDYVFGGGDHTGPTNGGVDCSGFILFAYGIPSTVIGRTAQSQYDSLAAYPVSEDAIQPGDLIFYSYGRTGPGGISHVGMYIGDGQMIEASNSADVVKTGPVRLSDNDSATMGVRRIPADLLGGTP